MACGILLPEPGINSWPLQGKHRDLTTGPPGKPLMQFLYMGLLRKGPDGLKSLDKRSEMLILQAASCVLRWQVNECAAAGGGQKLAAYHTHS